MALNRGTGRKLGSWALSILVSGVLLYLALRGVNWSGVWRTIAGARWQYLGAACAITSGSFFMRAVRWRILLNAEAHFRIPTVFWANMAGYLGNSFLPARAGELLRSVLISRRSSLSTAYVLTTALAERLMDVIALVLWSSLILLTVTPKPQWMEDLSRTMAIVAGMGAVCVLVLPHAEKLVQAILLRIPMPHGIRTRLQHLAGQVLLGLRAFHDWGRLAGFVCLTVMIWVADACGAMVTAHALGLHFTFQIAMLLLAGMGLGSALPSTPGYVGVYQFVAVSVLTPFGIPRDGALAYILVVQALAYVLTLAYGLPGLYLLQGSASLALVRKVEG
jgi:uncharacterized protein (TIRG00374 family)